MIKPIVAAFSLLILSIPYATAGKLISFEDPKTKLYGFKNEKGKVVVFPQFQIIVEPVEGELLIPVVKDGTFYLMDRTGELKFESYVYDNGWDYFKEGLARFLKDGKVGFHDEKGNVVIQPRYDSADYFEKGVSVVCDRSLTYFPTYPILRPLAWEITVWKCGVINIKGELIVPLKYDTAEEAWKSVEPAKSHIYEFLMGAELQCEDERSAEVRHVLNDLLSLSADELKKKRYKNYTGKPEWTAHYFVERHFVPDARKFLNEDTFYEELEDPRVKEVIQGFLENMN